MATSSLLLAAGRGERLRPLTDAVPKAALPMLDVPLGLWGLDALRRVATPVLVNASWLADAVALALGGPEVEIVVEAPEPFGTAGTLKALAARIDDRLLVHNCDLISDLDPAAVLETHARMGCRATIAVCDVAGSADLTHDGTRATAFVDRRVEQRPGAAYIGLAVFEKEAIAELEDRRPLGLGETLLRRLADAGDLAVHVHRGYRADVGTPELYLQASVDVLEGRAPAPPIDLPGEVFEVRDGKAYRGPGATAAPGTLGLGAVVLGGATVEPGANVQNAIVWRDVTIAAGRDVRDAVALDERDL